MKKKSLLILMMISALLISLSITVFAKQEVEVGQLAVIEKGKVLNKTGTFFGQRVEINGDVNGDVFAAGQDIVVNGKIDGNLFAAGNTVTVNGEVTGTVFAAGSSVSADTKARDAYISAGTVSISAENVIDRDLVIAAGTAVVDGKVGRNLNLSATSISVGQNTKIGGNLDYSAAKKSSELESKTAGEVKFTEESTSGKAEKTVLSVVKDVVFSILGLLIVWILGKLVKRNMWLDGARIMRGKPLLSFGIGAGALFLGMAAVIILLITAVGVPASLILAAFYAIFIYTSQIIVSVAIGDAIFKGREIHFGVWGALIGIVIIKLLGLIPFVGIIVDLMVVCLGMGAIVLNINKKRKISYQKTGTIGTGV